jgi:peptide/nickel transport system substrate-binding protein
MLKQPYAPLTSLLAFNNSAAIIIPSEKQAEPMKEFIGTGPYMLKERKADQYIQLVRFDGYKSRDGESDGYGGARHQYLDEIRFVPVPDANTRVEAAVSGQYDYVDSIPVESFDKLKASSASQPVLLKPFGYPVFVFNTKEGVAKNVEVRKAIRQALSMEDMLAAAFGSTDFFALDGDIYPEPIAWNTNAGVEGNYNVAIRKVLQPRRRQPAIQGEPIRILTSRQYEFHYKMAQVAAEYLKLAGFTVDLQVVDWATLTQRRTDSKLWDIYITHSPFLPEPALIGSLSPSSPGWWDTPARKTVVDAFTSEVDPTEAHRALGRRPEGDVRRVALHEDRRFQRGLGQVDQA